VVAGDARGRTGSDDARGSGTAESSVPADVSAETHITRIVEREREECAPDDDLLDSARPVE